MIYKRQNAKQIWSPEEEILEKINERLKYYDIKDQPEDNGLTSAFRQLKLKVNFHNKPKNLRDWIFYTISLGKFIAYDSEFFKKLYVIPDIPDNEYQMHLGSNSIKRKRIISAIQLENKDLIFANDIKNENDWKYHYDILIYRLKVKEYSLYQTIQEGQTGFSTQREYPGYFGFPKDYNVLFLKGISGNKFFCISNYGFKIYSLNEKNEYSLISLGEYIDGEQIIQEISENKFIFYTMKSHGMSYGSESHDELYIDMVEANEIKNCDLNNIKNNSEIGKVLYQSKLSCKIKELFAYSTHAAYHNLSDCVLIKKKIFIVMIENNLLIFDAKLGKLLN